MSYPEKYRKRRIKYRKSGHTLEETSQIFNVLISTISKWEKLLRKQGDFKNKLLKLSFKKIDSKKLEEYINKYSDAYLSEIAEEFRCSSMDVSKTLKKLGFIRKKDKIL